MPFQAKITRARFVYSPFSSEQMQSIGTDVLASIQARIRSGLNCDDSAAKPLKPGRNGKKGYPDRKAGHGLQPLRDWTWTGRTMRSMKVISASEHRAVISFTDPHSDMVAHANNLKERQFGLSPKDDAVRGASTLRVLRGSISVRKAA
jgi:hypothetical protein